MYTSVRAFFQQYCLQIYLHASHNKSSSNFDKNRSIELSISSEKKHFFHDKSLFELLVSLSQNISRKKSITDANMCSKTIWLHAIGLKKHRALYRGKMCVESFSHFPRKLNMSYEQEIMANKQTQNNKKEIIMKRSYWRQWAIQCVYVSHCSCSVCDIWCILFGSSMAIAIALHTLNECTELNVCRAKGFTAIK